MQFIERISTDGLPLPRRQWATFTISLAVAIAVLESTTVSVALPTIARELGATAASSVWIVNAYQLAVMVALLPLASLGDIIGYRRVFCLGLLVFTSASLACAAADSLPVLIGARVVQGLGAAGIMSVIGALVRFTQPRHRLGRGIAANALVSGGSAALGPTVAGAILLIADWPWLFAFNVPLGLAALVIGIKTLPHTPRSAHRFDVVSALLTAFTFGLLITGLDGLGHGGDLRLILLELAFSGLFGYLLVRRQLSVPAPLLPVDLLRIPVFALSISTSVCAFAASMLVFVFLPFHLQNVLQKTPVETGFLMTSWPLMLMIAAPVVGRLADRHPAGLLGSTGLLILTLGLGLLAILPPDPTNIEIVWRMAVCGLGFALFQSPNNRAIISAAPVNRTGGASGMLGTARLLGQTLGAVTVALVFNLSAGYESRVPLAIAACFALGAGCISSLRLRTASVNEPK
ncbi:MFS transporter [Pseudomonas sp. SST3]|uniref:MFS transporter n=1 Tax=Pseudomonas sp. SST3 TaxID=2267882 RepID=UPI0015B78D85|nr:MFS transporter [Pseudomonas sp. SST3]